MAVAALLALLAAAAALTPVADSDIWWHLAAAREMWRTGDVLRTDPFSLGAAGRPWIDVHWLFQLLVHAGFQRGGLLALVLGKAALVALGALILLAAVRTGLRPAESFDGTDRSDAPDPRAVGGALLALALPAALLAGRHLLLVRPVILSLVFLAFFLWVLERYRAGGGRGRGALLLLPIVQVVWVNCQGLSALGPALVGGYLLGDGLARLGKRRELPPRGGQRLLIVLGLLLAAGLVTPFGASAALLPLRLLGRLAPGGDNVFSANIAENVPPFVLERTMPGQMAPLIAVMLLVALSFLVARPLVVGRLVVAVGFAGLALMANRNVLLFYWVAVPLAALNAAPAVAALLMRGRADGRRPRWLTPLFLLGTGSMAVMAGLALRVETSLAQPSPFRVPAEAARRIGADPWEGRVFAADHYGGYLIWALFPRARPYIDTRLVLRTADEYTEYLGLADYPERFETFARRHRFDHVLLPTAYPDRYLGLIQHLYESTDWRLVHTDGTEVLFARADHQPRALDLGDREVVDTIVGELPSRYPDVRVATAARLHLARLLLAVGEQGEALHVLATAPAQDRDVRLLTARCHLADGDVALAEQLAQALVNEDDDFVPAHTLLALVALTRGSVPDALPHLRRALSEDPHDQEARMVLDRLESAMQAK